MIMMGLKFTGEVPFREVYITGLIRDEHGDKMSKSKGNIIDPLDLIDGVNLDTLVAKRTTGLMQPQLKPNIEKATRKQFPEGIPEFGTDALRFTFAALASTGRDIRFDLNRIEGYRNFCNKLWNAARYVLMNTGEQPLPEADMTSGSWPDRWIRARFGRMLREIDAQYRVYRFDLVAKALYDFAWYEFCDYYLELSKRDLQTSEPARQAATRRTLAEILEALMRALHPLMPFITEEIWQKVAPVAGVTGATVMLQPFPDSGGFPPDDTAEAQFPWLRDFALGIRQIRSDMDIAPSKRLPVLLQDASADDEKSLAACAAYLQQLVRIEIPVILKPGDPVPVSATALLGGMKILVPMADLVDVAAERERLGKALTKSQGDRERVEAKLANRQFVDNAPAAVVDKEREKLRAAEQEIAQLKGQLAKLAQLG